MDEAELGKPTPSGACKDSNSAIGDLPLAFQLAFPGWAPYYHAVGAETDKSLDYGAFGATHLRGLISTVRATSLPICGRPGRKNWRPRSPADTRFRSIRATNATGSGEPIRGGPLRSAVETSPRLRSVAAAKCVRSFAIPAQHLVSPDAAPRTGP